MYLEVMQSPAKVCWQILYGTKVITTCSSCTRAKHEAERLAKPLGLTVKVVTSKSKRKGKTYAE